MMEKNNDMREFSEKAKWVFSLFDKIRGHISTEDYSVILFLIYLRSENLIDANTDTIKDIRTHSRLEKEQLDKLVAIAAIFERKLSTISENSLSIIFNAVRSLDPEVLNSGIMQSLSLGLNEIRTVHYERIKTGFEEIFELVLHRIASSQGRKSGEFIQPPQLTEFVNNYIGVNDGLKVYNPFAGLASFIRENNKASSILAQEINIDSWAVGQLRLLVSRSKAEFKCEDSLHNWPKDQKFDLIISNPPFGARLNSDLKKVYPEYRTIEEFLLGRSIDSLSDDAKAVLVLSAGTLFNGGTMNKLRQRLINEDLIEAIIAFPGGILYHTSIPFIVMVIAKQKRQPGMIKLVDASNFVSNLTNRDKEIDVTNLLIACNRETESESARIIRKEDVIADDYNLNVARYFRSEFDGVKLKYILEYHRGQSATLPKGGRMVKLADLGEKPFDFKLLATDVDQFPVAYKELKVRRIETSCVLLSLRSKFLNPIYFKFQGIPIYLDMKVYAYRIDEDKIDPEYLMNELKSDYVREQIQAFKQGTTIPFIKLTDVLEIKIKLPSIEEQRAKVAGLKEISPKIQQLEEEKRALTENKSSTLHESKSTFKHSLGTPLLNIGSSLRNIEMALSKNFKEWHDVKLNERYEINLKDTFESIYTNLELVNTILINSEHEIDFSNYKSTPFDFIQFIKKYVNGLKSSTSSNVKINLDIHPDISLELNNSTSIIGNQELLEIALNAIAENANKHAFIEKERQYKLEFRVSLFESNLKIEVANTGKKFPENFGIDQLIRKNSFAGNTGNTGQGGYDINEIVKFHNNGMSTLELITDNNISEFATVYSFLIPLNI